MKAGGLERLYCSQLKDFSLAAGNYAGLQEVISRTLPDRGYRIGIQHNPARMVSTNADVSQATLERRPCFLCSSHWPAGQKGMPYGERYSICVNPYPIFDHHFTMPSTAHTPQRIAGRTGDLLDLAADFPGCTVFYNGPECGASAPDHFHFQMVPRHRMPTEADVLDPALQLPVVEGEDFRIFRMKDYLRELFVLRSGNAARLTGLFDRFCEAAGKATPYGDEPKMNLLCWKEDGIWTLCIFPRRERRPRQFYAEGEDRVMFSPGCVDMAGLVIAPRRCDYDRYGYSLLEDLFRQVTILPESTGYIIEQLQQHYT